ncbi:hypothetical protein [Arenibaculum pallidiluteum]|uniref:hypothetical protein n=1 Tax=Arenibaculum pallidiluteum TaxID=2812559 RepID=UPI002E29D82D|nr:hypothetical protein [Arenibaculum pallidiluteum]
MLAGAVVAAVLGACPAARANDYPTVARVDYVLGCMETNGQTQQVLQKCSCSIDAIAEQFPYQDYTALETVKVMSEAPGDRGAMFRGLAWAQELMDRFRKVQVAADLQCF